MGGFGSGTFSRTNRGNFERWHLKAGVHKYQNVPANQFAVFAQSDSGKPMAQVLSTGKAENPSQKPVTVSLLFSWTNMVGWFRDGTANFNGALNDQNKNVYRSENIPAGTMQGIVFDRLRHGHVTEEWDGQFAIATLVDSGVEVSYQTNFDPRSSGDEIWKPFSTTGRP